MDVGRETVRVIQRADPHETHRITRARVVAPDRHMTDMATGDFLPLSALRRCYHDLGRASEKLHAVGFDHGIQRKRRPRFALTPAAGSVKNLGIFAQAA